MLQQWLLITQQKKLDFCLVQCRYLIIAGPFLPVVWTYSTETSSAKEYTFYSLRQGIETQNIQYVMFKIQDLKNISI